MILYEWKVAKLRFSVIVNLKKGLFRVAALKPLLFDQIYGWLTGKKLTLTNMET